MKDVFVRAFKTFWQATLASLIPNIALLQDVFEDGAAMKSVLISIMIGAIAAGLSAVYNGVIAPLLKNPVNGKDNAVNDNASGRENEISNGGYNGGSDDKENDNDA